MAASAPMVLSIVHVGCRGLGSSSCRGTAGTSFLYQQRLGRDSGSYLGSFGRSSLGSSPGGALPPQGGGDTTPVSPITRLKPTTSIPGASWLSTRTRMRGSTFLVGRGCDRRLYTLVMSTFPGPIVTSACICTLFLCVVLISSVARAIAPRVAAVSRTRRAALALPVLEAIADTAVIISLSSVLSGPIQDQVYEFCMNVLVPVTTAPRRLDVWLFDRHLVAHNPLCMQVAIDAEVSAANSIRHIDDIVDQEWDVLGHGGGQ